MTRLYVVDREQWPRDSHVQAKMLRNVRTPSPVIADTRGVLRLRRDTRTERSVDVPVLVSRPRQSLSTILTIIASCQPNEDLPFTVLTVEK